MIVLLVCAEGEQMEECDVTTSANDLSPLKILTQNSIPINH